MAESYELPITPHDCVGSLSYSIDAHISAEAPNAFIQETTLTFYHTWYSELLTELPRLENGYVYPLEGYGIGTELNPDVFRREDVIVRVPFQEKCCCA